MESPGLKFEETHQSVSNSCVSMCGICCSFFLDYQTVDGDWYVRRHAKVGETISNLLTLTRCDKHPLIMSFQQLGHKTELVHLTRTAWMHTVRRRHGCATSHKSVVAV